jgi:hypothetical protein
VKIWFSSLFLCGVSAVLSAGTITTPNVFFDLTTGGGAAPTGTTSGSLEGFDPTLGTLTGVTVFFTNVDINMDLSASLISQAPASISAEFFDDPRAIVPGFGEFQPFFLGFSVTFGCTGNGTEVVTCSATQDFDHGAPLQNNQPGNVVPGGLAAYIGGPVPFSVLDDSNATGTTNVVVTGNPTGTSLSYLSTEVTGLISLQYTYDSAVPEPESILLIGGGIALLGLLRVGKQLLAR